MRKSVIDTVTRRMSAKQFILWLPMLFLAVRVSAQEVVLPKAGDVGLGASVSSTADSVLLFYHLTDSIVLAPKIGFFIQNYADTFGGVTQNYPATWWDVGFEIYFQLLSFNGLSLQAGAAAEFASEGYQNEGNTTNYQYTFLSFEPSVRLLAMITRNLGVFTLFGAYFYWQDTQNLTLGFDSSKTGLGVQSVSLGVAYYLK